MAHHSKPYTSLNFPEENDETRSEDFDSQPLSFPHYLPRASPQPLQHIPQDSSFHNLHPQFSSSYIHQAPFLSWDPHKTQFPSSTSPHSLPSCLPSTAYQPVPDSFLPSRPYSLPGSSNSSLKTLDPPRSLLSFLPSGNFYQSTSYGIPEARMQPTCCGHCRPSFQKVPGNTFYRPSGLTQYRQVDARFDENSYSSNNSSQGPTHLPQEQRKVFVTYEADSDEHLNEIIKFVAILRNNGFDTHMDVLEQQLNSISKIDCMERYLNELYYRESSFDWVQEKTISARAQWILDNICRYYETVSAANISMDCDERTSNTVYIHRQLQSEFIQNGCRNYRFIPVLFPGAKKCFVPTWLQNTHVYSWPKDQDDILRRLLRVEKYTPPPIGHLPNIVSIPL